METAFKLAITLLLACLIYYQLIFLRGVWRSHLDPRATVERLLGKLKPEADLIATRDPKTIYQNGKPMGEVRGPVKREADHVIFARLVNTTGLDRNQPIDYQREALRIVAVGGWMGEVIAASEQGTHVYHDVLTNVVCELVP